MDKLLKALPDLLVKQANLDSYIMDKRGITDVDTIIEQRMLAFAVELCECANEWQRFKYWKENNHPRTEVLNEHGEVTNPLLEEYVDVLHFALSIHNYHEGDTYTTKLIVDSFQDYMSETNQPIVTLFRETLECNAHSTWMYGRILANTLVLGNWLGLSEDDILAEYDRKYQENIHRQESGY
ncbi:dUTP diphosphatase [Streptococcus mutans]|nr:dUTP diphosphatase [Streptococcus mutans]